MRQIEFTLYTIDRSTERYSTLRAVDAEVSPGPGRPPNAQYVPQPGPGPVRAVYAAVLVHVFVDRRQLFLDVTVRYS